jgi:hypothetical protein
MRTGYSTPRAVLAARPAIARGLRGLGEPHTIARTIRESSQPKALTNLSRTKHRRATEMNESNRKTKVTTKMERLRPSSGNILSDCLENDYREIAAPSTTDSIAFFKILAEWESSVLQSFLAQETSCSTETAEDKDDNEKGAGEEKDSFTTVTFSVDDRPDQTAIKMEYDRPGHFAMDRASERPGRGCHCAGGDSCRSRTTSALTLSVLGHGDLHTNAIVHC